jgi:hypothetical protein
LVSNLHRLHSSKCRFGALTRHQQSMTRPVKFVLISYLQIVYVYLTEQDYDTFVSILPILHGRQHNDPDSGAFRRILRHLVQPHPVLHPGFEVLITHEDPRRHPNFPLLLLQFRLLRRLLAYPLGCRSLVERRVLDHIKFYYLAMSFTAHAHSALIPEDYLAYVRAWFNFQNGRLICRHFKDEIRRLSQDTELILAYIMFQDLLDSTLPDEEELRPPLIRTPPLNP